MENIVKKEQLYEGKAKKVFATNDPDLAIPIPKSVLISLRLQ